MTSSNPNFDEKCNKIGRNPKNCGFTGLERLKCLFYTISRHKAEGKLSFEIFLKVQVDIMVSPRRNLGENKVRRI